MLLLLIVFQVRGKKRARDFRKENTESRVRIGFKGQGLVLYGRLKNETKFKTLKEII